MSTTTNAPRTDVPKPTPEAEAIFRRWLTHLDEEFTRHTGYERRSEIVRDELHALLLGKPHGGRTTAALSTDLPFAVFSENLDPRNVSLPAEMPSRGADTLDCEAFQRVKPLIWFWQQFDRSALGLNLWLGFRFRNTLGLHIFKKFGKDVYIYPGFVFLRGYNSVIEDGTRIEPNIFANDRDGLTLSGCVKKSIES